MNMAVFSQQFYFYLGLISIMSSLFLMMNLVYAGPTGFSLELIHSDSIKSPLYPGKNLTQLERMERAFQQTKARQQQLTAASMNSWVSNNTSSTSPNALRPPMYLFDHYVVKVGIGSVGEDSHPMVYYLTFDTASDLFWLQCEALVSSFPQNYPYFPWHQSISFSPIPCDDHVLCPTGDCYGEPYELPGCKYNVLYADGSNTTGFLAKETLTVDTDNGQLVKIVDFIFGCGMHQINFGSTMGLKSVGIMGLGGGWESIINQLGLAKFEYCLLPSWTLSDHSGPSTFLRFGSDTKIGAGGQAVHTTPMFIGRETIWYTNMIDISVGGVRIGCGSELELKSDGTGGCVFDTGTPYSSLSSAVFGPLQARLLGYFLKLNRHPPPPGTLYELCFERPFWFEDYPAIIFHFHGGAEFEIETRAAFILYNDFFCFNILRSDDSGISAIVGGIQQGNHRILYNVGELKLSWANEQCVADS